MMSSIKSGPRYTFCYILMAFSLFFLPFNAQSQAVNAPTVEMRVQKLTQLLNLTPVQQNRYAKYLVRRDNDRAAFSKKQSTLPPDELQKLQMELKSKYDSELQQILTPQQYKKLNSEAAKIAKPKPTK
jgi:hypothetical protein